MAVALLRKAAAADSTLLATSSALRRNLMKNISVILSSNRNTASIALTMISKTLAAVSIIGSILVTQMALQPKLLFCSQVLLNNFLGQRRVGLALGLDHNLSDQEGNGLGLAGFDIFND